MLPFDDSAFGLRRRISVWPFGLALGPVAGKVALLFSTSAVDFCF
jgi:hypothetical protein